MTQNGQSTPGPGVPEGQDLHPAIGWRSLPFRIRIAFAARVALSPVLALLLLLVPAPDVRAGILAFVGIDLAITLSLWALSPAWPARAMHALLAAQAALVAAGSTLPGAYGLAAWAVLPLLPIVASVVLVQRYSGRTSAVLVMTTLLLGVLVGLVLDAGSLAGAASLLAFAFALVAVPTLAAGLLADRLVARLLDVTAGLARVGADLESARHNPAELARARSQFVAMISHDLRNPLQLMMISIGLLRDELKGRLTPEQRDMLRVIEQQTRRLHGMSDDLVDLASADIGRLVLTCEPVNVRALLEEAADQLRATPGVRTPRVTVAADADMPPAWADAVRVRQILNNLARNASKHAPAGTVILAAEHDGSDQAIVIKVTDSGAPIAPEDQLTLFDEYRPMPVGRRAGGHGLGLAIARRLVEAHGGRIGVESPPVGGPTFWFTLPVSDQAEPPPTDNPYP